MHVRYPTALLAACFLVVTSATPVRADIAPWAVPSGSGPQVQRAGKPTPIKDVQMARELVRVALHSAPEGPFSVVDATFWLRRVGPGQPSLRLAFPGEGVDVGGGRVHSKLHGFQAFVDGLPVAVDEAVVEEKTQAGPPGRTYGRTRREQWHRFAVTVPAAKQGAVGKDVVVRVRYAVAADRYGTVEGVAPHALAGYILHTGGLWAGVIDEAVIEVVGVGVDIATVSARNQNQPSPSFVSLTPGATPPPVRPAGAVIDNGVLRWILRSLEPVAADDLDFIFAAPAAGFADDRLLPVMAAAARMP